MYNAACAECACGVCGGKANERNGNEEEAWQQFWFTRL